MKKILSVFFLACCSCIVMAQDNVIDEIVWVVVFTNKLPPVNHIF